MQISLIFDFNKNIFSAHDCQCFYSKYVGLANFGVNLDVCNSELTWAVEMKIHKICPKNSTKSAQVQKKTFFGRMVEFLTSSDVTRVYPNLGNPGILGFLAGT